MAKLTLPVEVKGKIYEVEVTSGGLFRTTMGEEAFVEDTMEKLRGAIQTATRKRAVRVAVPAAYVDDGAPLNLTITGIHGATRKFLYRTERGDTGQISGYDTVLRPLTDEDKAEYTRLSKAAREANTALAVWRTAHAFKNWANIVERMIEGKVAELSVVAETVGTEEKKEQ